MTFNLASQFYEQASVHPARLALSVVWIFRIPTSRTWSSELRAGLAANREKNCLEWAFWPRVPSKLPEERLPKIRETAELDALIAGQGGIQPRDYRGLC